MKIQEDKCRTGNVILAWDGLRSPEQRQSGSTSWNVQFLISQSAPEVAELQEIATIALNKGQFLGTLPAGGHWPLTRVADVAKFGPEYANYLLVGGGTSQGIPPVLDVNGNVMDIMTYGPMLYPGCVIQVLLHAFDYNNINKGISFGLDGVQIVDATAPKLPVAVGMSPAEVAAAWGGAPGTAAVPPVGQPPQPAVMAPPGGGPSAPLPPGPGPGASLQPPAGPVLTAKAEFTYEQYVANGWTEDQLRQHGMIQ